MTTSHTGRLLVATPALEDPNFDRTVILVLDHDDEGALGVVVNRTSSVALDEVLEDWAGIVSAPHVVFGGGPVEPTAVVALGHARAGVAADGWTPVTGRIRLVDLEGDPAEAASELEEMRVFAGYAGWGPGQLEAEILEGAWFVIDAEPADVFDPDPDHLWQTVLRRQPGRIRLYANFPEDPTRN